MLMLNWSATSFPERPFKSSSKAFQDFGLNATADQVNGLIHQFALKLIVQFALEIVRRVNRFEKLLHARIFVATRSSQVTGQITKHVSGDRTKPSAEAGL